MNVPRIAAVAVLGLIGVGAVAVVLSDDDADTTPASDPSEPPTSAEPVTAADPSPTEATVDEPVLPAPPLTGLDGWLGDEPGAVEDLAGSVIAVQFWSVDCEPCRATTEQLVAVRGATARSDFEVVGIHSSTDGAVDEERIAAAASDLGGGWPIGLDAEATTLRSWQQGDPEAWPLLVLLDRDGNVRETMVGTTDRDAVTAAVDSLIDEPWDADLAAELDEWVERDVDFNADPM